MEQAEKQINRQEVIENKLEAKPKGGIRALWRRLSRGEKVVTVIMLVIFLSVFYITLDANKYRATVRVIEGEGKVGVNPTTEVLDFGDLSPGTSAVRRVDIQNGTPIPMWVAVVRTGAINDLMKLDKNYFVVPGNSGAKIEFTVYMPASAPIGETMDGRVMLFKIPWVRS